MAKWTDEAKAEAKRKYAERIAKLDLIVEEFCISDSPKECEVEATKPVEKVEEDTPNGMRMDYDTKIQSMTNAVKILPPNMIKDGRHLRENIQAICGFMVSDEMMDEVYKEYTHPEYN